MGDIADMMLDGTLCECCGEYIGHGDQGYPGYCSAECARNRGAEPEQIKKRAGFQGSATNQPIAKKLVKRLEQLALCGTKDGSLSPKKGEAMYAGALWEHASSQYERLRQRGFVECRIPHNAIHKARAVITPEGQHFLSSRKS